MTHARSRAREAALKVLYQVDIMGEMPDIPTLCALLEVERLKPGALRYAQQLLAGCSAHREHIDTVLCAALEHWDMARLAAIDRSVLRLGVFELLHRKDVPPKVVINEAVELAKKYSTEKSGPFVNGILDSVRKAQHETS